MKKEVKTLTVLLVLFFIVVGSAFGVSNSLLIANNGMKYLPAIECDDSITSRVTIILCT